MVSQVLAAQVRDEFNLSLRAKSLVDRSFICSQLGHNLTLSSLVS